MFFVSCGQQDDKFKYRSEVNRRWIKNYKSSYFFGDEQNNILSKTSSVLYIVRWELICLRVEKILAMLRIKCKTVQIKTKSLNSRFFHASEHTKIVVTYIANPAPNKEVPNMVKRRTIWQSLLVVLIF